MGAIAPGGIGVRGRANFVCETSEFAGALFQLKLERIFFRNWFFLRRTVQYIPKHTASRCVSGWGTGISQLKK